MTAGGTARDWAEWHRQYDEPGSALAARLELVQGHVRRALDEAPAGPIQIISMCAGQGRDVIGAVRSHRRKADVRARLVERDPGIAGHAQELAEEAGLPYVDVVTGDASVTDAYAGAAPGRIVLACGIFGNIDEAGIRRCIGLLPMLCDNGATLIWTRHRRPPDQTPRVRRWFAEAGFVEVAFDSPPEHPHVGVGAQRWPRTSSPWRNGVELFRFGGGGSARSSEGR